jgi:tetratricopeptide (TPR) repeat protein
MGAKAMNRKSIGMLWCVSFALLLQAQTPKSSDADYQRGMSALSANDLPNALQSLETAVSGDPDNLRYANDYRQAIIRSKQFDRALEFLNKMTEQNPKAANLHLNYGFAFVDKIPAAGSITQVILANNALTEFTKALELKPSWIAFYTRGESYLFWPKIFNRAAVGVADLKKAMEIQNSEPKRDYHMKTYIALGDGYWKTDQLEKARATWQEGLMLFPESGQLKKRLGLQGDELKKVIETGFDPNHRVDTDLKDLWSN